MKIESYKRMLLLVLVLGVAGCHAGHHHHHHTHDPNDPHGGVEMGVSKHDCDDGKWNIQVDWDGNPKDYTCMESSSWLPAWTDPDIKCTHIHRPWHKCLDESITYKEPIPTSGAHRPLWPVYGEYRYVPVQRWLHSLEHGAAVFLYHPCADQQDILALKQLARSCLRRHVISPNCNLTPDTPLAILTYGCKLTLGTLQDEDAEDVARTFIKDRALTAPEWEVTKDGQFSAELIKNAKVITDIKDSILCPTRQQLLLFKGHKHHSD